MRRLASWTRVERSKFEICWSIVLGFWGKTLNSQCLPSLRSMSPSGGRGGRRVAILLLGIMLLIVELRMTGARRFQSVTRICLDDWRIICVPSQDMIKALSVGHPKISELKVYDNVVWIMVAVLFWIKNCLLSNSQQCSWFSIDSFISRLLKKWLNTNCGMGTTCWPGTHWGAVM